MTTADDNVKWPSDRGDRESGRAKRLGAKTVETVETVETVRR